MTTPLADLTTFIDTLVSSTWMFLTFVFGLAIVGFFFSTFKPFKQKWSNYSVAGFFFVASTFSLVFLTRGSFGDAVEFIDAKSNGKQLVLIERHEVGDGDGGTSTVYRLYTFDLITGQRIHRQLKNYAGIIALKNDMVVFSEAGRYVGYNIFTGEEMKAWSKEEGFSAYPELQTGIDNLSYSSDQIGNSLVAYLKITALDGKHYYMDINTERLHDGDAPSRSSNFSSSSYTVNRGQSDRNYYYFENASGDIKRLSRDKNGQDTSFMSTFLEPAFLAYDANGMIIRHYETLAKKNAIITAIDLDLRKQWEVKQSDVIELTDDLLETESASILIDGKLIVTFGGWIICLDSQHGKVLWKTRA